MSEATKFTEDILTAAKQKAKVLIDEAQQETQKSLEEAKAHISREADDIIRNARSEGDGVKRRQISEIRHKVKIQEQVERSKMISDVLEQAKARAKDLTKDETKYLPYLASVIENGIREIGIDAVMIHLRGDDMKRIDRAKLEQEAMKRFGKPIRIEWAKEPIEAMGGAIVSSTDGKTRIVNTLDERFDALESKLLIEAAKTLFGEQNLERVTADDDQRRKIR